MVIRHHYDSKLLDLNRQTIYPLKRESLTLKQAQRL
jgi:hypothetical protein